MPNTIDVFPLVMGLLGGLALFLYGMERLVESLQAVAGAKMKDFWAS